MDLNIEHIAKLARISLTEEQKAKFPAELDKILGHFKELQKLNTDGVEPMMGGTDLKNVFRKDADFESPDPVPLRKAFPESKDDYLKVPQVFE